MKPVKDKTLEILEDTAIAGAKAILAYLGTAGHNDIQFAKAKIGAAAIGAYARTRASESNRTMVELAAERMITTNEILPKQIQKT